MYYVGIDVGKTGAMGVLDSDGKFVEVTDFVECLWCLQKLRGSIVFAYLEEVHSMPKQGVKSTFTFGENFGWWKGVLQGLEIPFKTIRPQDWMKGLVTKKETPTDKPGLIVARQMYPEAPLKLQKHHNRADAILIARVCWKREGF